jgi:hypothetical protein
MASWFSKKPITPGTPHMPEIDLETLPKREVTAEEFRAAAEAEQWKPDVIRILTTPPLYHKEYLKVGLEMLRLTAVK